MCCVLRLVPLLVLVACVTWYPSSIHAIHSHDTQRQVLQQALSTFTQAVHLHQATLPTCTPAQERCIAQGQAKRSCDAIADCQTCTLAISGYTCQPTTRCLTSTPPTAIIPFPTGNGYTAPTQWAVGGPKNCAVTADCYFNQQVCMYMGQNDDGEPSKSKCSAIASRPEYAQQECQFCKTSVSDGVGSLASSDCTHTPKAGCTDTSEKPAITRSGKCPARSKKPKKPAVSVDKPTPATTTTTTTTTTKITTSKSTEAQSPVGTTTAPTPVRKVSSSVITGNSIVSIIVTIGLAIALA